MYSTKISFSSKWPLKLHILFIILLEAYVEFNGATFELGLKSKLLFLKKKTGKNQIKHSTPPKKYPFWNEYYEETIRQIAKGPFGGWSFHKGLCIHIHGTFIEPFFPWFFYCQTQTYILASHGLEKRKKNKKSWKQSKELGIKKPQQS